jgi:hypothetical protein
MTINKMLAGQRSPRNPIIVEVMRDYGEPAKKLGLYSQTTFLKSSYRLDPRTDPDRVEHF